MTATMAQPETLAGNACTLHRSHGTAKPLRTVLHHVWPLGMGGPNIASNKEPVCDNGHYSVHILIAWLYDHVEPGVLSSEPGQMNRDKTDTRNLLWLLRTDKVGGSKSEQLMAIRGYLAWDRAGRPPAHPERVAGAANPG